MIRAVIDTNILVRAFIKPNGTVGPVLQRLRDGAYTLLYADMLLTELVDVLRRPRIRNKYNVQDDDIRTLAALIFLRGDEVSPDRHFTVCRDAKDNFLLDIAVAGSANVIVSGDNDVITLSPFEGIPVISAAAFLAMLTPSS